MKYLSILFLVFNISLAQYKVKGVFIDSVPKIKNVALYKLVKGESKYLKYTEVKNNSFEFSMDSLATGFYRALYKNVKTGYVDFIYNNEDVSFEVDSKKGQPSAGYLVSRENQLLQAYNYNIAGLQSKLDSVQMSFFKQPTANITKYKEIQTKINGAQAYYENLAKNDYCLSLIKASKRYNAPVPFTLPANYVSNIKEHFFDFINFEDNALANSTFLKSRISDYIFYLHQHKNKQVKNTLYKNAINTVLDQINNLEVKQNLLMFLIKKLIKNELKDVVSYTINRYKELPLEVKDLDMLREVEQLSKTLIGTVAPDIKISSNNNLYTLKNKENYLIVFWSSVCSHCSIELPKIKEYLKNNKDVTVIAVGIENKEDQQKWEEKIKNYPSFKNVISLGKWESKYAIDYNVNATPSFFLLNREKKIIAKPNNLKELKKVL